MSKSAIRRKYDLNIKNISNCLKKNKFQTEHEAFEYAWRNELRLKAYHCGVCDKFHLTSKGIK